MQLKPFKILLGTLFFSVFSSLTAYANADDAIFNMYCEGRAITAANIGNNAQVAYQSCITNAALKARVIRGFEEQRARGEKRRVELENSLKKIRSGIESFF